jgi:hypothetical protein
MDVQVQVHTRTHEIHAIPLWYIMRVNEPFNYIHPYVWVCI